jgi:hypothetical protein
MNDFSPQGRAGKGKRRVIKQPGMRASGPIVPWSRRADFFPIADYAPGRHAGPGTGSDEAGVPSVVMPTYPL